MATKRTRAPGCYDRGRGHGMSNPTLSAVYQSMLPQEEDERDVEMPLDTVYAVLDPEACQVKIGITSNMPQRLRQLNVQRGRALELVGTMRGGYDLERAMHGRFQKSRREGREWYSSEILAELMPLLDAA